jgi:hypothetical protein
MQPWIRPYENCRCCPIYVTQRTPVSLHLPRERLIGCLKGSMTSQALGGVNFLAVGTASEGSPPLLEVKITHTHAQWYHHYLQHPGNKHLEETMNTGMYWKGMHTTIRSLTKTCRSCQINKRGSRKYGHLPPKSVYTIPC